MAKMPAGILAKETVIVKKNCIDKTTTIPTEILNSDDFLEALNIVIKYILRQKGKIRNKK